MDSNERPRDRPVEKRRGEEMRIAREYASVIAMNRHASDVAG